MINKIWTPNRNQWSIRGASGSFFLLSKNRLSDNKSKRMAIIILRDSIIPPIARAARKPKNGNGLNKNDNKLK